MIIIDGLKQKYTDSIARIEKQNFSEPWSEEALRCELTNPVARYFVAVDEGRVAGYMGVHIIIDEAYITNIAVDDEYKRQGIGRNLMQTAIVECKEKGCAFITLEVRVSNEAAIGLYTSFGFKNMGIRRNFYTNPAEDAMIMTLDFRE